MDRWRWVGDTVAVPEELIGHTKLCLWVLRLLCLSNREFIHYVFKAFEEHMGMCLHRRDGVEKKGKRAKKNEKEMKKMTMLLLK